MDSGDNAAGRPAKKRRVDQAATTAVLVKKEVEQPSAIDSTIFDKNPHKDEEVDDFMRHFNVIDEVEPVGDDKDDDVNQEVSSSEGGYSEDEGQTMLEEQLSINGNETSQAEKKKPFILHKTFVLEEKGVEDFQILPDGWVTIKHDSGMPIYYHRQTKICTLSKPYSLGTSSVRRHNVPISAIPCLNYQIGLSKEASASKIDVTAPTSTTEESAQIPSATENCQKTHLEPEELREHCKKRFQFKELSQFKFHSWPMRRQYSKIRKAVKVLAMPGASNLISIPRNGISKHGESYINPNGKSYTCLFYEYVQRVMKVHPQFTYTELEGQDMPFSVTVTIKGLQYGTGRGSSKREAKAAAAKASLEICVPGIGDKIKCDQKRKGKVARVEEDDGLQFFDQIKILDPRIEEICAKTTEHSPFTILHFCLHKNFIGTDRNIKYEVKPHRDGQISFTMSAGGYTATAIAKNKRSGKNKAAQKILQDLHPHITSWGSLLRLYGRQSFKTNQEKKSDEREITDLQGKASVNQPNLFLIDKLREEMMKLHLRDTEADKKMYSVTYDGDLPSSHIGLPKPSSGDISNIPFGCGGAT